MQLKTLFKNKSFLRRFSTSPLAPLLTSLNSKLTVETEELVELLHGPLPDDFTILDASIKRRGFDPLAAHLEARIPSSVFFDF